MHSVCGWRVFVWVYVGYGRRVYGWVNVRCGWEGYRWGYSGKVTSRTRQGCVCVVSGGRIHGGSRGMKSSAGSAVAP